MSSLLANGGKKVLVLEAAKCPRYRIGESRISATVDLNFRNATYADLAEISSLTQHEGDRDED
ncbi:hypothetical protein [Nocardiopsis gilva]|uniref:hypothetical protein n=1 Tax=Nocardiopsis gilva TaxID=280236 RepID=UPI00034A2E63|nr:hypothetical protein [Nocardiopsis gilva]